MMNSMIILCFFVVFGLLTIGSHGDSIVTNDNNCFNEVESTCFSDSDRDETILKHKCDAKFAGINHVLYGLEEIVNMQITRSYEYLMMATHFGTYQINRDGFAKLFLKLSDEKWNGAIDLIKYITKRGGHMNFNSSQIAPSENYVDSYEAYELPGVAKALDFEKNLAESVKNVHKLATEISKNKHEPGVMEYIQDLIEKLEENVRFLSGIVSDLVRMAKSSNDRNLGFYEYDKYLSSVY